jgi:hypothetical protein
MPGVCFERRVNAPRGVRADNAGVASNPERVKGRAFGARYAARRAV